MNISSKSKKFFVGFNWKMNPNTLSQAQELFQIYDNLNFDQLRFLPVVFVPSLYLSTVQDIKSSPIGVGSQDISAHSSGAFTGQISGQMLGSLGVGYTLINHSETHREHQPCCRNIAKMCEQALQNQIIPIVCVSFGDLGSAKQDLETQLQHIFDIELIAQINKSSEVFYIALEPILNIGSGKALGCRDIDKHLLIIKNFVEQLSQSRLDQNTNYGLLYGGSVNADNILEIGNCKLVDGFLLGGASIIPDQITKIYKVLTQK